MFNRTKRATTVSAASGTAARCNSVLKSSYGQFSLAFFCRVSKRLLNGRLICFSLVSMCIVETRLELMFSNEAIICQKIGFFFLVFFLKIGQLHIEETGWCPPQVSPDVTSSVVFFYRFFFFFLPFALGATFRIERAETTFEDQPACCCQGAALVTTVHTSVRRVDFQH